MELTPPDDAPPAALPALLWRLIRAGTVVACMVAVSACGETAGSHSTSSASTPTGPSPRVGAEGVSVAPQSGWAALPSHRKLGHGSRPLAFLSLVNFRLDAAGRKELRGEAIRRRDVVATISELSAGEYRGHGGRRLRGPLELGRSDFLGKGSPRVPRGHAVAERFFSTNARRFSVDAEFGRRRPSRTLVKALNRNLATLRVARR